MTYTRAIQKRPTFRFTGTLHGVPKTIEVVADGWATARMGGALAGARHSYRITPATQCFIEESVEVVK